MRSAESPGRAGAGDRAGERGLALLIVILALLVVGALAAATVLTTSAETLIAASFRSGEEAFYAAEGAAEWVVADLDAGSAAWADVVNGTAASSFVDGPPAGLRPLGDGSSIDLGAIASDNPSAQFFAYGRFEDLVGIPGGGSALYIVALTAPDATPGWLRVRTDAFGPRGAHRTVETILSRRSGSVHVESWREIR